MQLVGVGKGGEEDGLQMVTEVLDEWLLAVLMLVVWEKASILACSASMRCLSSLRSFWVAAMG